MKLARASILLFAAVPGANARLSWRKASEGSPGVAVIDASQGSFTGRPPPAGRQTQVVASSEAVPVETASANLAFFDDQALFSAATCGLALEDFETVLSPDGFVEGCPNPFSSDNRGDCFLPGDLQSGFEFHADYGATVTLGSGVVGPSTWVAADQFASGAFFEFALATNVYAVGFNVFSFLGNDIPLSFVGVDDAVLDTVVIPGAGGPTQFFGVVSDVLLKKVISAAGAVAVFDNLQFGNTSPKVEPLEDAVVFVRGATGAPADNGDLSVTATDPEELEYTWDASDCPGVLDDGDTASPELTVDAGTDPHVCKIEVEVCKSCGCTTVAGEVVIVDPAAGFVTGGGFVESPAGAYTADAPVTGKASFGFVSKYNRGKSEPFGDTSFEFAGMQFNSTSYDWLVVDDPCAKFKGVGLINDGADEFGFVLVACDNGEGKNEDPVVPDSFHIKIWKESDGSVVYDNLGTEISGGNIQIHQGGKKKDL